MFLSFSFMVVTKLCLACLSQITEGKNIFSCHPSRGHVIQKKSWNHASNLCSKVSRIVDSLNKLKYYLPPPIIKQSYFSFVYPHNLYGIEVLGKSYKTQLGRLMRIIDKCFKIINHLNSCTTDRSLLKLDPMYNHAYLVRAYIVCGSCDHFRDRFANLTLSNPFRTRSNLNMNLELHVL